MNSKSNQIALVEFHDARIGRLIVLPGGNTEVHFEHLSVFYFRSPVQYDVMSCQAILRASGTNLFQVQAGWALEDDLSRIEVDGHPLANVSAPDEVSKIVGRKMVLTFSSGGKVEFLFQGLSLELTSGEFMETWDGPLVNGDPI